VGMLVIKFLPVCSTIIVEINPYKLIHNALHILKGIVNPKINIDFLTLMSFGTCMTALLTISRLIDVEKFPYLYWLVTQVPFLC